MSKLRRELRRELPGRLGIRVVDVLVTVVVIGAVELNVITGGGPGAVPLNGLAYLLGAILALPVLLRRRWPFQVLIACTVLLFAYYSAGYRRNISPAPLLSLPLFDAAQAGYLAWAIVIPAVYMAIGLIVVEASTHQGIATLASGFLPSIVVLALAVTLGEVIRSRRALAAETAERLRLAREEHEAEAARQRAEERLRIARELHDTVAHGMATISVQAGSALHVLGRPNPDTPAVRAALAAIRDTSKAALAEMRHTLGQLRSGGWDVDAEAVRTAGLDRLAALAEAVRAAGTPVVVRIEGEPEPLTPQVDHAAYRILQESLTNVLRHAGPLASATVGVCYTPGMLTLRVTDNGTGGTDGDGSAPDRPGRSGHGIAGMAERAAAVGGELSAGPRPGGGFEGRRPAAGARRARPGARPGGPAGLRPQAGGWRGPPVITVLLADDQALVRAGFRMLLESAPDMAVVGEAHNGGQAVALARQLHPDVVLMDLKMPEVDGITATRRITADPQLAGTRIVVLTTFGDEESVFGALRAGASGFLVKDLEPEELLAAVRVVARGDALLAPSVTRALISAFTSGGSGAARSRAVPRPRRQRAGPPR